GCVRNKEATVRGNFNCCDRSSFGWSFAEIKSVQFGAFGHDRGAFDRVAQLAHVAGTIVLHQLSQCVTSDWPFRQTMTLGSLTGKGFGQNGNVFASFAQRSDVDSNHAQSIEE